MDAVSASSRRRTKAKVNCQERARKTPRGRNFELVEAGPGVEVGDIDRRKRKFFLFSIGISIKFAYFTVVALRIYKFQ